MLRARLAVLAAVLGVGLGCGCMGGHAWLGHGGCDNCEGPILESPAPPVAPPPGALAGVPPVPPVPPPGPPPVNGGVGLVPQPTVPPLATPPGSRLVPQAQPNP
jgi:hypothetical protein